MKAPRHFIFSLFLGLILHAHAFAQFGARAETTRPAVAPTSEDATAAVTTVRPTEDPRALVTTDELLLETPGAKPHELGTLGSYSALSIRGAETDHTAVMLGEIPLGATDDGAFDVSTLPLPAIERLEVWRGGTPTWLGSGAIGGVLRVVPRAADGTHASVSAGLGSFGLATLRATSSVGEEGGPSIFSAAGISTSRGNFPYLDTRGTAFTTSDDVTRQRSNGGALEIYGLTRGEFRLFSGKFEALLWGFGRNAGVPGPAISPTVDTRRDDARLLTGFAWTRALGNDVDHQRFQIVGSASIERSRFTDLFGELGLGLHDTNDRVLRTFLRSAIEQRIVSWLDFTALATWRVEHFSPDDVYALVSETSSTRNTFGASAELRAFGKIAGHIAELRPSARMDIAASHLSDLRANDLGIIRDANTIAPNFRLGALFEIVRGLTLTASLSSGTRLPTLLELFGDRAYLNGDPTLRPERSVGGDVGFFGKLGGARVVRGTAELRGFVSAIHDEIIYTRTSQFTATPLNIATSRIFGAEIGAGIEASKYFRTRAAFTLLDAKGGDRTLPLRPREQLYVRAEGLLPALSAFKRLRVYADVLHVGSNFADAANLVVIPSRTFVGGGVGCRVWNEFLEIDASVRDIFDTRGSDVLGFPLPGRTFALLLTFHTDEAPR